jgi:hypothetical protein
MKLDLIKPVVCLAGATASNCESSFSGHMKHHEAANAFTEAIERTVTDVDRHWVDERAKLVDYIGKLIDERTEKQKELKKTIESLKPKVDASDRLKQILESIKAETDKLSKLKEFGEVLSQSEHSRDALIDSISSAFIGFKTKYEEYADAVSEYAPKSTDGLKFEIKVVLRLENFRTKIETIFDNRSLSKFNTFDLKDPQEGDMTVGNLGPLIKSIISKDTEAPKLKKEYDQEKALREIFTDWFNIRHAVNYDNDGINQMSPGKKSLVLLKLLIDLSDSKCPILIDQPEDDLDNRSIFNELIPFIKKKKVTRQIIVVTHNANIVLGGDAEQIIVANQSGVDSPNRDGYKFEYRQGPIEDNMPVLDKSGNKIGGILNETGIQKHICDILEGGKQAFDLRKNKYNLPRR